MRLLLWPEKHPALLASLLDVIMTLNVNVAGLPLLSHEPGMSQLKVNESGTLVAIAAAETSVVVLRIRQEHPRGFSAPITHQCAVSGESSGPAWISVKDICFLGRHSSRQKEK